LDASKNKTRRCDIAGTAMAGFLETWVLCAMSIKGTISMVGNQKI